MGVDETKAARRRGKTRSGAVRRPRELHGDSPFEAQPQAAPPDVQPTEPIDVPAERLQRVEERVVPRVERKQAGEVVLAKHVVEEPATIDVKLAHDRIELERNRVSRPLEPDELPITTRGEETVVLVIEERLEVRKVPYVVEEIHLRREVVREERQITETVRKERFELSTRGDIELQQE
jgi:uncharacterized protein (TIGR02271 family)